MRPAGHYTGFLSKGSKVSIRKVVVMRAGLRVGVLVALAGLSGSMAVGTRPVMAAEDAQTAAVSGHKWAVVLHGGAGVIERKSMSAETDAAYRAALKRSIQAAADVLEKGGSSMDAIEAAIKLMEDDPLFNAGKGAVFTAEGKNELDSA